MKNSIFTIVYSKDHQARFERAIREKRLDSAYKELKKIPSARNPQDEMHRVLVLAQGYKALADTRREFFLQVIEDYLSLGTINEIRVEKELLRQYRSLGTIEAISAKLAKISEFEESAKKVT